MLELITSADAWIAFFTLTALELVLGIDNIIFISILVDRVPQEKREFARRLGLFLAMFMRIALISLLSWIITLTAPLFTIMRQEISGRDLILITGGLFLLWKSTREIHHMFDINIEKKKEPKVAGFWPVIFQIIVIDLIFSLDSIITAVGMVDKVSIMVLAVITAVVLMMFFARTIGYFVSNNPTIKMLALSFLVVIGCVLIADGFGTHVPKGYIYFAMAFSTCVEILNIKMRSRYLPDLEP
jgi:predicted tellurium resistance membrane protein TerC